MYRHVVSYGMIIILFFVMTACSNGEANSDDIAAEEDQEEGVSEEETSEEGSSTEDSTDPYITPLTGVGTSEVLDHRPIAVPINNHNQARPQSGLQEADLVYEVLAEGTITRFIALYHSEIPEVLGPIRSLRPYYIHLTEGVDPVYAHAGGSPAAIDYVQQQGLPSLDDTRNGGMAFYRADFRDAPHNLYSGEKQLREAIESFHFEKEVDMPHLTFRDEEEELRGQESLQFEIEYHSSNRVGYEYDEQDGTYTRYVQGEPHLDLESEAPLVIDNILVMETSHVVLDDAGRREVDVSGEGKGYLFQQGFMQEVTWTREDGLIRAFKDGEEVGLVPGKTWVNVIPNDPGLEGQVQIAGMSS